MEVKFSSVEESGNLPVFALASANPFAGIQWCLKKSRFKYE